MPRDRSVKRRACLGLAGGGLLAATRAWGDHGGAGLREPGGSGFGLGWLFVAGLVVVVALAAWALFAPAAEEADQEDARRAPGPDPR
jgi:hypothetical protein